MQVLSPDEIGLIHASSLDLLETHGIKVNAQWARELLAEKGASVDKGTKMVQIPRDLVETQLRHAPASTTLHGPDGTFQVEISTKSLHFTTLGTPNKIDEWDRTTIRKTRLRDTIDQMRLVDGLENLACSHVDVWPNDVPFRALHCHVLREWAKVSHKPQGFGCHGRVASQDMMTMASIIVGSESELKQRPRLMGFFVTDNCLELPHLMLNGLRVFAEYHQPVAATSFLAASPGGPFTLAGGLTQVNAEILAIITLAQLIAPGTPVLYGALPRVQYPPGRNVAYGSAETAILAIAAAQMGHHYNLPSRGLGGVTDARDHGLQSGFERFMTLLAAAASGANYITCAGTFDSTNTASFDLLAVDDELAGTIRRLVTGLQVNPYTIRLGAIKEYGTRQKHLPETTMEMLRESGEFFIPTLVDRNTQRAWEAPEGSPMLARAHARVEEILASHQGLELPGEIETELTRYLERAEARTADDYMEREGIA